MQTQYTYEPFGFVSQTGAASTNSYKYTGREDDGTGLIYYRARYYQPTLQRSIGEDPIRLAGGNINIYAYVENNPLRVIDPYGLMGVGTSPPGNGSGSSFGSTGAGAIGQAGGAFSDFWQSFGDMRDASIIGADKYFHCRANCQAAKRGSVGKQTACLISDYREVYGYYKDGEGASSADQVANHWGRDKAGENASCEQICQIFRPKGLPSRY